MGHARKFSLLVNMPWSMARGQSSTIDPRSRPIVLALLLSICAHLAMLSVQRTGPVADGDRSLVTDLRLWIEQPADRDLFEPEVADVRQQSAPQSGNPRAVVAETTDSPDTPDAAAQATAMASQATGELVAAAESAATAPGAAAADMPTTKAMAMG